MGNQQSHLPCTTVRITYFQRSLKGGYSLENAFKSVIENLSPRYHPFLAICKYESRGLWRRAFNTIEACFRQGSINHITGDVHYLTYFLRKKRTVLTIADLVYRQNTRGLRQLILHIFWYSIPTRRAAKITTISETTKAELLQHVQCDPGKIHVIPVSISARFQYKPAPFNAKYPTLLQIGTSPNKNVSRLMQAVAGIPCRLHVIGTLNDEELNLAKSLTLDLKQSTRLTTEQLLNCYEECDLVTFASTYEGFGMPIVEANAVGRPVLTSNTSSMPEVAGNAACLVNPFEMPEIRSGILKIIENGDYRIELIENGLKNCKRFSAEKVTQMYEEIYFELLQSKPKSLPLLGAN